MQVSVYHICKKERLVFSTVQIFQGTWADSLRNFIQQFHHFPSKVEPCVLSRCLGSCSSLGNHSNSFTVFCSPNSISFLPLKRNRSGRVGSFLRISGSLEADGGSKHTAPIPPLSFPNCLQSPEVPPGKFKCTLQRPAKQPFPLFLHLQGPTWFSPVQDSGAETGLKAEGGGE